VAGLAEPTHVLAWMPEWLLSDRSDRSLGGVWELQTITGYDRGIVHEDTPEASLAWDTHPVVLAAWAGSVLGHPVRIELAWRRIGRWIPWLPRFLQVPWRREPVYWVTPGQWGQP